MDIDTSLLGPEVNQIIHSPSQKTQKTTVDVYLSTIDYDVTIAEVASVEVLKDYNSNITDYIVVEILLPMGDFVKEIYPQRNNLEMTIVTARGTKSSEQRYKAVILGSSEGVIGSRYTNTSRRELNKNEYARVRLQCINRQVEVLRSVSASGIFRDSTVLDVINSTLTADIKDNLVVGESINPAMSITTPNNDRLYDHILVPSGTNVLDIPSFLQNTVYGVYNGNIGTYLATYNDRKNGVDNYIDTIFVYPLYNTELAAVGTKNLVIYAVPNKKYEMIDNTYIIDGDSIKILAGDSSKLIDDGESSYMNTGSGFNTLDSNSVMNRALTVTEEGVVADPEATVVASSIAERDDGMNFAPSKDATDNMYRLRSEIMRNSGSLLQMEWRFSNDEHLYPGMPVVYVFLDGDSNVVRLNGVLQSVYSLTNVSKEMTVSILNIFLDKYTFE